MVNAWRPPHWDFHRRVLLTGRGARGRIWGIGLSDLTIESFHSTRTGLKPSAEGSLTRCVVGHQEGGGADVPKLKLGLEMLSSLDTVCVVWCASSPIQHVVWVE